MKNENDEDNLSLVQYMNCIPLLDKVNEALRFVDLQRSNGSNAEKGNDTDKEEKYRDSAAAGELFRVILLQITVTVVSCTLFEGVLRYTVYSAAAL